MKTLTVCEPFAFLIMHGFKKIENRKWPTSYRGPLLIHSGLSKAWMPQGLRFMEQMNIQPPAEFPVGYIVGKVDLVDCVPFDDSFADPYASGPYCWMLANARRLREPIPAKGYMGLWDHPEIEESKFLTHGEREYMCPHCGLVFTWRTNALIPRHGSFATGPKVCPGSEQVPRNPESDRRPLWQEGGAQ